MDDLCCVDLQSEIAKLQRELQNNSLRSSYVHFVLGYCVTSLWNCVTSSTILNIQVPGCESYELVQ